MTNELTTTTGNQIVKFNDEQISVIRETIAKGATKEELKLFIWQCERTGLDPFSRQIYFTKIQGKVVVQTAIDGFRVIAERSGAYEGQTPPLWCGKDGVWKEVWLSSEHPTAARVGVYKKGFKDALYAIAHWNEAVVLKDGRPNFAWSKMQTLMLAKVAESQALRKAFPNELSGLYTQEEMGNVTTDDENSKDEEGVIDGMVTKTTSGESEPYQYECNGETKICWGKFSGGTLLAATQRKDFLSTCEWYLKQPQKDDLMKRYHFQVTKWLEWYEKNKESPMTNGNVSPYTELVDEIPF